MTDRIRLTDEALTRQTSAPFTPTPEQRATVRAMSALCATEAEICDLIINPNTDQPISTETLRKYFTQERLEGAQEANQKVSRALFQRALGKPPVFDQQGKVLVKGLEPDVTAGIWWEKSRLGLKEGTTVEHTGKDGAPLETTPTVVVMIPHNNRNPLPPHRRVVTIDQDGKPVDEPASQE